MPKWRNDEMVEMLDQSLFFRFLLVLIISVFQKENNFWTLYISFRHFAISPFRHFAISCFKHALKRVTETMLNFVVKVKVSTFAYML